jgi:glucuronate isomerase
MTEFFRDRLEMLPMNKWNAFFSDAYCAEWVYGKSTLTRNRLALALSELVEEALVTEETAAEMARMVLYDNPRRLYLGEECAG